MFRSTQKILLATFALASLAPLAGAQTFYSDRTSFLMDSAVTSTTSLDFDDIAVGTDLTNQTIGNVTLGAPSSSPLQVIDAATGVRNPMSASSGTNVLSPGGNDPNIEDDDLSVTFTTPVRAAGLDVVFDVPDGASYVGVKFMDAGGNVLFENSFIDAPAGAPGYQFVGYVSDTANIKSMVFDEFDPTPNDDNVAYDSIIHAPAVPAPSGILTGLIGAVPGIAFLLRRRK